MSKTPPKLGADTSDISKVAPVDLGSETPWINWMRAHLGEHEIAGNKDNPFIMSLYKYADYPLEHDEVPWCAACVCAALELTGYADSNSAGAISYKNYGTHCTDKFGCVVVFEHTSGKHHVAFRTKPGYHIGGNQDNALSEVQDNPTDRVIATRWPVKKSA